MAKRSLIVVSVVAASLAIVLCGVALAAPKATIVVGNNFFSPARETVKAGTQVRFRWTGGGTHNVVKRRGPGGDVRSRTTARRGVHLAKVLRKRGVYRFVCTLHPTEMRLKLRVK